MKTLTQPEHEKAVLAAHSRFALALSAIYEYRKQETALLRELESAEGELRALARRQP